MSASPRVAIVHEWFTAMRGGEKCVEALCELFPDATLYALLHVRGSVSPVIERMPIRTSFIQHLPFAASRYRHYLPLFPTAVERFSFDAFDIVITSSHCVAKGVRVPPHALHICYCHTPMRYVWDQYEQYFGKGRAGLLTRMGMSLFANYLRRWDVRTSSRPSYFIANSENVRERIKRIYHRDADVIYPPVDTAYFQPSDQNDGYFLIVSALVPYKRVDIAVEAFNTTGDRLLIVGDGPERERLARLAHSNVQLFGWQDDEQIRALYAGCAALVFPGEEDFGIVPVEAMASGKPVIAYGRGGALETVLASPDVRTGILFQEPSAASLIRALEQFRLTKFDPATIRNHSLQFDRGIYKKKMAEYILARWVRHRENLRQPSATK